MHKFCLLVVCFIVGCCGVVGYCGAVGVYCVLFSLICDCPVLFLLIGCFCCLVCLGLICLFAYVAFVLVCLFAWLVDACCVYLFTVGLCLC